MPRIVSFVIPLLRLAVLVPALAGGAGAALAQADPPGRIARLNYTEGKVTFAPAGDNEWTEAALNRPLVPGDRICTDQGVRAEVQVGSSAVRMDGRTRLTVLALDDQAAQLSVTQGTVTVRVRSLPEGENFEIDTPNLAYRAAYPGDYRIDVDAERGATRVTIVSGTGAVYGDKGQALPMGGGQQITFKGRSLEKVNVQESPPQDSFDRWAVERNRREDQSVAARYVPRDAVGYQLLDASGEWRKDAIYGPVWFPPGTAVNWVPYRNGHWEWVQPWGWTWFDDAPWAFITSHYGRWTIVGPRWAWVPGRMGVRPTYAPALVAFVGNANAPLAVGGKPGIVWFPLGPGEAWQPFYQATPRYISSVNANMPPLKHGAYAFQHRPDALTAIALEDFQRGKPAGSSSLRLAANALTDAKVVAPPPKPERGKAMAARPAAPAPEPATRQVTSSGPALPQPIGAEPQARQQAQREARLQQARAAEDQRKLAAKSERRKLEQQRIARQRQPAGQQAMARAARVEVARAREAKRDRVAKRERELQQARRAQQPKRLAAGSANKEEQARRAAHAQVVEQARRAAERDAQVLARQRAQREAWQRQQQALAEQFRRDQQAWEEQQQARPVRQRPDLRRTAPPEPDVWQRGIPVLTPGRTS